MIELVHLEKKYENATPLADVNAMIGDGDVISIIGPSGTGKSTLIRCINMLDRPTGGKILLDGVDIRILRELLRICVCDQSGVVREHGHVIAVCDGLRFLLGHFFRKRDNVPFCCLGIGNRKQTGQQEDCCGCCDDQ